MVSTSDSVPRMDFDALKAGLVSAVPFNSTIGIEYDELTADRAVLRLPDRPDLHNHVAGPHAGAMFSLGEAASGGIVIANFAELLGSVTPLAKSAEIAYRKVAMGDVTATATLQRSKADVVADLETNGKAEFDVSVTIADATQTTAEMTVRWHLRKNR